MCITRSTPQLNPRNTVSTCTKKYDRELHRKCNCQHQPIFHHIKLHSLHSSRNTVIALVGIVSALSLQERVNFRGKTRQNIHCCRSRWRQTFCCSHDTRAWNGNQRFSSATLHCSFVRSNCRQTNCIRPAITAALTPPATGSVKTQARKMLLNSFQSTFCRDRAHPTKTTEPTLQCVVLIGRPRFDAVRTVNAAPSSMQKPLHINTLTLN